jgi:hypothetical protein
MPPPAFHGFEGAFVGIVTGRDRLVQMFVLRLYDLVRRISMEREITRPAQLLARHCFHIKIIETPIHRMLLRSCSITLGLCR